jgi:predicted ATPase
VLGNDDGALALPSEVGAGIAQVLPVIVAALADRVPFVMIEQPEIHVHPRLQTGLGDLFIEASASRQLLIETHSEHLILRLLRRIRETTDGELTTGAPAFTPDQLSVMHVQSTPAGAVFTRLRVDATGEFIDRWPTGFFAERAGELF